MLLYPVLPPTTTRAYFKDQLEQEKEFLNNFNIENATTKKQRINKIPIDVLISVVERIIWKQKNGTEKETIIDAEPFRELFIVENINQLDGKIQDYLYTIYPSYDSGKTTFLNSYKFEVLKQIKTKNMLDVPMHDALPFKLSFLKYFDGVSPVSLEEGNGECVIKSLSHHLKVKGKPMNEKNIKTIMNQASMELYNRNYKKRNGITGRMILYFCKIKNISLLGLDQKSNVFVKYVRDETKAKNYKSIIFYIAMNHFYLIDDPKIIKSLSSKFANNSVVKTNLQDTNNDEKDKIEPFFYFKNNFSLEKCKEYEKNVVVILNKTDLNEEFKYIIEKTHNIPNVKFNSYTKISEITLENGVKLRISNIKNELIDTSTEEIHLLCKYFGLKPNNQSLTTLMVGLLEKFFLIKREKFTDIARNSIFEKYNGECNICNTQLTNKYEIDHIRPLANGGSNDESNLQLLCCSCHRDKTITERENGEYIREFDFTSRYNLQSYELLNGKYFNKCPFTHSINELNDDDELHSVDMNKTRRNLLMNCEFPIYNVLDNIEPFCGGVIKTGFYYIETDNNFPFRGNGFYFTELVKYGLDNHIIYLTDIKYQYIPSKVLKKIILNLLLIMC